MHQILDAGPSDRFIIYLNDHRGLVAAESDLARRAHASNVDGDSELVTLLAAVLAQNLDDRDRLDDLIDASGGRSNPFKTVIARVGERIGRLKPNGQLRGYSPLSRVIEIEALISSTSMRRSMWDVVAETGRDSIADDAGRRADLAAGHVDLLREQLVRAAQIAFAPA